MEFQLNRDNSSKNLVYTLDQMDLSNCIKWKTLLHKRNCNTNKVFKWTFPAKNILSNMKLYTKMKFLIEREILKTTECDCIYTAYVCVCAFLPAKVKIVSLRHVTHKYYVLVYTFKHIMFTLDNILHTATHFVNDKHI